MCSRSFSCRCHVAREQAHHAIAHGLPTQVQDYVSCLSCLCISVFFLQAISFRLYVNVSPFAGCLDATTEALRFGFFRASILLQLRKRVQLHLKKQHITHDPDTVATPHDNASRVSEKASSSTPAQDNTSLPRRGQSFCVSTYV